MSDLSALFSGAGGVARTEEVTLTYGKVNLKHQSASYAALIVSPPFQRPSAVTAGVPVKGSRQRSAVSNWEGNGGLVHEKVMHAPNSVILLQVSWKRNGANLRDASVFIRLRPSAALLTITASLPTGQDSQLGDRAVMFIGRGDIMDSEELKVLGIEVPRSYVSTFMNAEEIEECFEVVEALPEKAPRPVIARIATGAGEVKLTEMPVAPRRRLRIRR